MNIATPAGTPGVFDPVAQWGGKSLVIVNRSADQKAWQHTSAGAGTPPSFQRFTNAQEAVSAGGKLVNAAPGKSVAIMQGADGAAYLTVLKDDAGNDVPYGGTNHIYSANPNDLYVRAIIGYAHWDMIGKPPGAKW